MGLDACVYQLICILEDQSFIEACVLEALLAISDLRSILFWNYEQGIIDRFNTYIGLT